MAVRPGPRPERHRTTWVVVVVALVLAVVGVVVATLLGDDETAPTSSTSASTAPGDGAGTESTTAADAGEQPTATPDAAPAPAGTREDPFAAGDPVVTGGWTTTIGPTDLDAWSALGTGLNDVELAELAPPAGTSYVVAPMTVTFAGGAPVNLGSFEVSYVGASGTSYAVIGSTCRLALDDSFPTSDVYEEPEVTGTVCTDVPTADATGGTWRVAVNIYDDSTSSASTDYEGHVATE